jgi:predicted Ser/Thr protein kinase
MNTRKQTDETKPIETFGTAPSVTPAVKQTSYSGTLLKDRYLIEGELGRGGIGVVYLARDTQLLQRRVVIKVLLESSENSLHTPWFRKKFDQEIEALVRIDHPGVVGVLDAGVMPDGKPFFVMQFVEGTNLRSVMQKEMQAGPLDLARVAHIIRQIGVALTAAHDKGIIHRDLKPENVMVQRTNEGEEVMKLIDFGIATVKDSQMNQTDTGKTKVAGALPYMAPEQLRGEPLAASDTWSLGVMAYELLTGRMPFNAETLVHLHDLQRQGPQPLPSQLRPDLPPAAEQFLLRALAFAPEDRYARARDFGDALAEALLDTVPRTTTTNSMHGAAPSAPTQLGFGAPPTTGLPAAKPAPGKSPLPYFAVIVLLGALIVGGLGYWRARNATPRQPENGNTNPGLSTPARELNYSLTARMKRNASGPPVELAGEIVFSAGDELRFKLNSPQDGYLYIIGEGPQPDPKTGLPLYNLLFPTPSTAAQVNAGQTIFLPGETGPGFFVDTEQGSEKLWLIWSQSSLPQLEQLKKWYNDKDKGAINDSADTTKVRDFLKDNEAARPVAEKGVKQMTLKGRQADLLIYPIELAHY